METIVPGQRKKLSMRMRFLVSGLACLLMSSVLVAAAFPSGLRLTPLNHAQPAAPAIVKAADARPSS